jgi:hypothetical protein
MHGYSEERIRFKEGRGLFINTIMVVPVWEEEKDRVFTQVTVQPEFDGRFKLF